MKLLKHAIALFMCFSMMGLFSICAMADSSTTSFVGYGREIENGSKCLTVSTFALNAGDRDPVISWDERPIAHDQLGGNQMWDIFALSNGYYAVSPSSNGSLDLNISSYSTGACNVRARSANVLSDYSIKFNYHNSTLYSLCLPLRSSVMLTNTTTPAYKFSTGSGYTVKWQANTGSSAQKWYVSPTT